jgi:hypothetical protein
MRQPLRIGVCNACGHLILQPLPRSRTLGTIRGRTAIQADSWRGISWGSLFSKFTIGGKTSPQPKLKSPDEKARQKAQDIVKQLRERSERTTQSQSPHRSEESPQQILKNMLLKDSTTKGTPRPPGNFRPQTMDEQTSKKSVSKAELRYSSNPFLSPLQTEQREAMRRYLAMARNSTEKSKDRGRYPWEETPVPWNTNIDKLASIRRLLKSRSGERVMPVRAFGRPKALNLARTKSAQESEVIEDLSDLNEDAQLEQSKLYQHLRDHHTRCLTGYTGPGAEEAIAADRELHRRMDIAFRQLDRIYKTGPSQWYTRFRSNILGAFEDSDLRKTRRSNNGSAIITPFIHYIMAREGFDLSLLSQIAEIPMEKALDEFGCIKADEMHKIIATCISSLDFLMQ